VEARNASDQVIYDAGKLLELAKKQLEKESWEELENSLVSLRMARDGTDRVRIAKETSKVTELVTQIGRLVEVLDTHSSAGEADQVYVLEKEEEEEPGIDRGLI